MNILASNPDRKERSELAYTKNNITFYNLHFTI